MVESKVDDSAVQLVAKMADLMVVYSVDMMVVPLAVKKVGKTEAKSVAL